MAGAVGLSFQIVDDVLDLTATEEALGKPVASDLREGKATLAVIHSSDHGTARDRQTIQKVLDDRSFEHVSREEIQEILVRNGSVRICHDHRRPLRRAIPPGARAPARIGVPSVPCFGCLTLWWHGINRTFRHRRQRFNCQPSATAEP